MRVKLLFFTIICAFGVSCGGGGGGGGGFVGAARVNVNASPNRIDTGDRTQVRVEISEVHENGISLKIRFPAGLTYVSDTSFLEVGRDDLDVGPTINRGADNFIYLVYYFSGDLFEDDRRGTFTLQLVGVSEVMDGEIEVDPDVDDPTIPNDREFDIDNPEFRAESDTSIEVLE